MPKYIRIFFYSFLLAPFYAYLIMMNLGLIPYYFLGSLGMILLMVMIFKKPKKLNVPTYLYPLIFFAIYYSIWDFFNGRYEQFGIIKLLFKNYPLHILSVLLIIENVKFDAKMINNFLSGFKLLVIASLIFSLIQLFIDPLFFTTEAASAVELVTFAYQVRNTSIWGYLSPLDVGLSFLPILTILIGYYYSRKESFKMSVFFIIGSIVAILNNSRWTILNLIILIFPLVYGLRRTRLKAIMVTSFSIVIVLIILYNFFDYLGFGGTEYLHGRILSATADSRFLAVELFQQFFPEKPIFGTGVRVDIELGRALSGRSSQIHVGYLSSLYEFGLLGSVFLFSFWYLLFKKLSENSKLHHQKFLVYGFLCFLLANLTLVEYSIFHIGLFLIIIFDRYYLYKISQSSLIRGVK